MVVVAGRRMSRISSFVIGFMCICIPARAGAWLPGKGVGQVAYQTIFSVARHSFGPDDVYRFHKLLFKSYTEYGLSDRIATFSETQYTEASVKSVYGETSGRNYASEGGLRLGLLRGVNVVSLQAGYQYGQAFALTVSDNVSRSQQVELRLLYGRNFHLGSHKIFLDLESFWRWTALPRPNEAGMDGTLGLSLYPDTQILLQDFSVLSAGYGADSYPHYALHKAKVSLVQRVYHDWYLQLGGTYAYSGCNVVAERGLSLTLWVFL